MGCLSFHPRKIVTTGEGGAVTTDDGGARRVGAAAAAPRDRRRRGDFDIPAPGLNYRLADVLCALGVPQLERLETLLEARERVARWYAERLAHAVGCRARARATATGGRHMSSRSTVATRRSTACGPRGSRRRSARTRSTRLTAYRDRGSFPGADAAFARALALPFAGTMTEDDVARVATALLRYA